MLMRLTAAVPVGALLGGYLAYKLGHRAVSALGCCWRLRASSS